MRSTSKKLLNEGRQGVYIDPFTPEFSGTTDYHLRSTYDARNVAVFGQLDGSFDARWGWSFGLRGENRAADYQDSGARNGEPRATDVDETTRCGVGRRRALRSNRALRTFVTFSRGYKAGGFNLGQAATIRPRFEPEYLWSIDVGAKGEWLDRRLYADITAFYMKRETCRSRPACSSIPSATRAAISS